MLVLKVSTYYIWKLSPQPPLLIRAYKPFPTHQNYHPSEQTVNYVVHLPPATHTHTLTPSRLLYPIEHRRID